MIRELFRKLVLLLAVVGGAVLAFAMFLTTADVIMRYFFHSPIKGVYEVIELLMGVLCPVGILYCTYRKGHVRVNIIYQMLPVRPRKAVLIFSQFCVLLVFGLLAWQGWHLVIETIESRTVTPTLEIPMWPASVSIFVSFLLILPVVIGEFIDALRHHEEDKA